MAAIILAGGRSVRMGGRDKAFLKIKKDPIINRQLKVLKKQFKKIIIVTNNKDAYKGFRNVKVVPDVIPGRGPLGGILTGLLVSGDRYNLVIACDMPFVNPGLARYMYRNRTGYDAVVPKINGRYEPLFCIYSKDCVKHILPLIRKKVLKISKLFSRVKVKSISPKEMLRFGLIEKIFMNINTPNDLLGLDG